MDLSIAIRTATVAEGRLVFSVGGGVVYDSNADAEYEETLHKGRTLFEAVNAYGAKSPNQRIGYCNGLYKPMSEIEISVDTEGFAYGYGIFETIRVDRGLPRRLDDHLARFENSWRHCFHAPPPDITWRDVIAQVILRNSLTEETAAVKLLAAAGKGERKHFDGTLLVTARSYQHRLTGTGRTGLQLITYPHPRHSPLGAHKTLNYAVYKMAGKWAKERLADEALILDVDQGVSETNTGNVFASINSQLYRMLSVNALPGTMENAVVRQLAAWGMPVEPRKLRVSELACADFVFITNALMGAVPVSQFDGAPMSEATELCGNLNEALLGARFP
jgi:para-aminobenzoate synthetase component 1